MDSVTHLAVGALCPLAFKNSPRTATIVCFGIIAGELPDIDYFAGSGAQAMFALHRGATHSILAILFFAVALALLLKLLLSQIRLREMTVRIVGGEAIINKADDWPLSEIIAAAFLALTLHVYLDCMTTFGTQIFWPFSGYRVALPALFIIDLLLTVPLLLILFYCLSGLKKEAKRTKQLKWARLGLLWAICYPLACLGVSTALNYTYNRDYTEVGTNAEKISLTPVLGSPFYWKAVAENEREYHLAWVAAYKPFKAANFAPMAFPKVDPAAWQKLCDTIPEFEYFNSFATFITVSETEKNDSLVQYTYKDLRYLYSVPNFVINMSGITKGLFNMQIRQSLPDRCIYAWRYLENGSDDLAMWTAVRPPACLDTQE